MAIKTRNKVTPNFNMSSLTDIIFLLLIFFMVSTSFVKQSQISISLPQADSTAVVEEVPQQIDIMITATGTYLINNRELINNQPRTIRNALQKVSGGDNSLPMTISADANARHQVVVTAMVGAVGLEPTLAAIRRGRRTQLRRSLLPARPCTHPC